MPFTISRATPADIPSLIEIWYNAFPGAMLDVFPDTPAVRSWITDSFTTAMTDPSQNTIFMIMSETLPDGTTKVGSWSKWIVEPGGEFPDWKCRWKGEVAEGMKEEVVGEGFFGQMAKQHGEVMEGRKHYFLEVLATHSDYRKKGLASKMLEWGCEAADREEMESYLDASVLGKPLYEKFGYVYMAEKQNPKIPSAPLWRPARKVES